MDQDRSRSMSQVDKHAPRHVLGTGSQFLRQIPIQDRQVP